MSTEPKSESDDGNYWLYGHLDTDDDDLEVSKNDTVEAGDPIGKLNPDGLNPDGPDFPSHLHLEVSKSLKKIPDDWGYEPEGKEYTIGNPIEVLANAADKDTVNTVADKKIIEGSDGNETLEGSEGPDRFILKSGDDTIKGKGANDTVVFSHTSPQYEFSSSSGEITITGPDGTKTLTSVEFAEFPVPGAAGPSETIDLRNGLPESPSGNKATDFITSIDLTGSFDDDLPNIKAAAPSIIQEAQELSSNTGLALSSFKDESNSGEFGFRAEQARTNSTDEIVSAINSLSADGGGDAPESQLTALINSAQGTNLDLQSGSDRFILLATDASFKSGGEFPTVPEVKNVLEANNATPIFATTEGVQETYEQLVEDLGRGTTVEITSSSADLTDSVRLGIEKLTGEITEVGTDGEDELIGSDDDDSIFGLEADDLIKLKGGSDTGDGGSGDDKILGGPGDDDGGTLRGGTGNDTLEGGPGNDRLEGGLDADTMKGGSGADVFAGPPNALDGDTITDFTKQDTIEVSGVQFQQSDLSVAAGSAILKPDVDGDGTADAEITLEGINPEKTSFAVTGNDEGDTQVRINQPPQLNQPLSDQQATEGNSFRFQVPANTFSDRETSNEDLSYSLGNPDALPEGLSFNATERTFNGTPQEAGSFDIEVVAADEGDATASDSFTLNVADTALNLVEGTADSDRLAGTKEDDRILGKESRDLIRGDKGDDVIEPGPGRDVMVGQAGKDQFVLKPDWGPNQIRDFTLGEDELALGEQLSFADLGISNTRTGTRIAVEESGKVLADLFGIQAENVDQQDFAAMA